MLRPMRVVVLAVLFLLAATLPARADLTAFVGVNTEPENRPLFGFALGTGLLVVGWEFEYMNVNEDVDAAAPSLRTGMASVYVQNPIPIAGLQFYGIIGAGLYRERFDAIDLSETNFGTNAGGGVKISLAGPLKLRIDYRVFTLRGDARYSNPQRIATGLTLAF